MKMEGREAIMEDNFRQNTRLWRMRKGLPQRTISKLLGHEKTNIINIYESIPITALDQDTKQRYADILGIPIQELYKEPVEMPVHLTDIDQTVCRINLETIRKAHGQSVNYFANQIGVSGPAYRSFMRGSNISLRSFWVIVDHLDIDPWLLATGKTHEAERSTD